MIYMHEEERWQQLSSRGLIFALRFVDILFEDRMSLRLRLGIASAFLVLDIYLVIRASVILCRAFRSSLVRSRSRNPSPLTELALNFCMSLLILGLTIYDVSVVPEAQSPLARDSYQKVEQSRTHGSEWSKCLALTFDGVLVVISLVQIRNRNAT